jgi:predicted ArsR family transcriptional regulator
MEDQTRQLLRLLADDLTDRLIEELHIGPVVITDLQDRMPESRQTLVRRLEDLQGWGIAVRHRHTTPGRGRPTAAWRLADDWVQQFENAVDALVLDLMDRRADRQRKGMRRRTRQTTKALRPPRHG